jgi:(p)ppGpp synthase/HD superfamily hydrolase
MKYELTDFEKQTHEKIHLFAIEQHRGKNCLYSGHEYKLHLDAVVSAAMKFLYLLDDNHVNVLCGCSLHDTIEDTGLNYNDIKSISNPIVADFVYNVTNELGKNRKERAEKTYPKIASCKYATFIKLCDRISNMKFGYLLDDGKGMFRKYQKEHPDFYNALHPSSTEFEPMWEELEYLCSLK